AEVRAHFDRHLSPAPLGALLERIYSDTARRKRRLRVCLLVPGGMDPSGTHRVIPCVLALVERLAASVDLHVLTLKQEAAERSWEMLGARVHAVPRHSRTAPVRWLLGKHAELGTDVLHALWMHPQGTAAAAAGALLRRPVLLHVNGGDLADLRDIAFGGRATWTGRVRLRAARAGALRVTAPSAAMVERARELGFAAERLTLGVALDRWPARAPQPRCIGAPLRLLSVGTLNRVKDHATLLRAVAMLRARGIALRLEVAGEDTLDGEVARTAAALGIADMVHLHGFMPQDALRAHMEAADALVVSSRHEADPIAALEAAIAGLAVVGTRVGHLAEWAPGAARVCAPGDATALAGVIAEIAQDDALRLRLAAAAQRHAVQWDADRAAARVLEIYREMARHGRH
ncbi:MAG TPA: glycosyltransferase, partial [Longimicrobiales bacterium]|nr:glycosyltransferase [Longimicrobiales bacterium]